jgi:holliday junction DNA helicase RuvA
MYEFVSGKIDSITPTQIVINCGGVGYQAQITLHAYEQFKEKETVRVFTHLSITENQHSLYGFASLEERDLFRALIGVSGVGPSTARVILSSYATKDLANAIIQGQLHILKSIKGIGPKTAQRLVIELQDKLQKMDMGSDISTGIASGHQVNQEALMALEALGFQKQQAAKVLSKISMEIPDATIETLIKKALQLL